MPSTSPGLPAHSSFKQVFPGAPTESLQSVTTFIYRFKRYVAYVSGSQLNILSGSNVPIQAITFENNLQVIAAEKESGQIVVGGERDVYVLRPVTEGWTKIWWEKTLSLLREDASDEAQCVSWGNEGEVLVGGRRALSLFSSLSSSRVDTSVTPSDTDESVEERRTLWSKTVSSPTLFATFSPSGSIIASCAHFDRLVKIWRRLSYEEGLFDYAYLPHHGLVTHIQWRPLDQHTEERRSSGVSGRHDEDPEVLYTIANDGLLRVWRTGGMHDLDIMRLHASIDLITAIPQSPTMTARGVSSTVTPPRYAFVIPSDQFCGAVNAACGVLQNGKVNHSMEHLKETASKEPDVIVTLDGNGRMSAWGLQSIGHKRRPETPSTTQPFHISHAEDLPFRLSSSYPTTFHAWFQDDGFHMLAHTLGNNREIKWFRGTVETFFSPATAGSMRLATLSDWCGHDSRIVALQSTSGGLASWSARQVCLWTSERDLLLKCCGSITASARVLTAAWLRDNCMVLIVQEDNFILCNLEGRQIAQAPCKGVQRGKILISRSDNDSTQGIFVQCDGRRVVAWSTKISRSKQARMEASLELHAVRFTEPGTTLFANPVSGTLKSSNRPFFVVDEMGGLRGFTASSSSLHGIETAAIAFETEVVKASIFTATGGFAAIASANRLEVTIVDLTAGYIEHRQTTETPITHLACSGDNMKHDLVAVGRTAHVDVLLQCRYGNPNVDTPAWVLIRSVSLQGIGLCINAIGWASDDILTVAAGNMLLAIASEVDRRSLPEELTNAFALDAEQTLIISSGQLSQMVQCPLPVWHPNLLLNLVQNGRCGSAASLLVRLSQKLKFWSAGDYLDPILDESVKTFTESPSAEQALLGNDTTDELLDLLGEKDLPAISPSEQQRLGCAVRAVSYVRDHEDGLDANAVRYLFNWKMQLLLEGRKEGVAAQANEDHPQEQVVPQMHWREVAFARQSTTQQPLLEILIAHYDNKLTWPIARRLGIVAWLSEREALEQVFEQLAQSAYRSSQPPDPVNASLFFLALHKKPTLLALWRIATWHKEQKSTMNFLKRDFNQSDARTAAKKNAYALMGKRRFEYAAAFFLLANDSGSATSLLAGQCEDVQLAVAIARLHGGEQSTVLRKLLEERILPSARDNGDRWLMSWCHSLLFDRDQAAQSLVKPLEGIRTWQQDDPDTLILYRQLRQAPSEHEYTAILRSARILRRMGLWLSALELVSRWEFQRVGKRPAAGEEEAANGVSNGSHERASEPSTDDHSAARAAQSVAPPSLLDSFESSPPPAEAVVDEKAAREAKAAELLKRLKAKKETSSTGPAVKDKKPEPTQFQEPNASSLLDSFGL